MITKIIMIKIMAKLTKLRAIILLMIMKITMIMLMPLILIMIIGIT